MSKKTMSKQRRIKRQSQFPRIFFDSLFDDYVHVQKRYQDRANGYLVHCPFLDLFYKQLNAKWLYFADKVQANPKKIVKVKHTAFKEKVQEYINNQAQITWMLYTINLLEVDKDYKKYNVASLNQLYSERAMPEDAVRYILHTMPLKTKISRWLKQVYNDIKQFFSKPAYAYT